ncbi:hypothetical protein SAMN04488581_0393 [Mycolicibacterium neoaurum]|uniref:hypothetical protein n=1 Tax=Mycolicibacterium neoaurum TaxID=1795 RepID=UPI00088EF681|nr:hypothetical protein [Mycolicibacterium neoaurum]SDC25527.1 hypothetical protein SAMN04488581_0393 [Mycolicibacterium neoaurum]
MNIPTPGIPPVDTTKCPSCMVPTTGNGLCSFCQTYTPPETVPQKIDVAINKIALLGKDLNGVYDALPADAPLFGCADLATGICHLRRAAEAIDRASRQLGESTSIGGVQ